MAFRSRLRRRRRREPRAARRDRHVPDVGRRAHAAVVVSASNAVGGADADPAADRRESAPGRWRRASRTARSPPTPRASLPSSALPVPTKRDVPSRARGQAHSVSCCPARSSTRAVVLFPGRALLALYIGRSIDTRRVPLLVNVWLDWRPGDADPLPSAVRSAGPTVMPARTTLGGGSRRRSAAETPFSLGFLGRAAHRRAARADGAMCQAARVDLPGRRPQDTYHHAAARRARRRARRGRALPGGARRAGARRGGRPPDVFDVHASTAPCSVSLVFELYGAEHPCTHRLS